MVRKEPIKDVKNQYAVLNNKHNESKDENKHYIEDKVKSTNIMPQ